MLTPRQLEVFDYSQGPNLRYCQMLNRLFTAYASVSGGIIVEGAENLPQSGTYAVTPNHESQLDHALVGKAIVDATGRLPHFVSKPEYWSPETPPFAGRIVDLGGGFPIDRGLPLHQQDPAVLARFDTINRQGDPWVIYLQGRRKPEDEPIRKAKGSIGLLAVKYGMPVIPAGIAGTAARDHMRIIFGKALQAEQQDFDLADPGAVREVAGKASAFRYELAPAMEALRLLAIQKRRAAIRAGSFTRTYLT